MVIVGPEPEEVELLDELEEVELLDDDAGAA